MRDSWLLVRQRVFLLVFRWVFPLVLPLVLLIVSDACAGTARGQDGPSLEAAVADYVAAVYGEDLAERELAREKLVRLRPEPSDVVALLEQPRALSGEPGVFTMHHLIDGVEHPTTFVVPESYSSERIPVRIMLHGGVSRAAPRTPKSATLENFRRLGHITVLPAGWRHSTWWHSSQVENLDRVLRRIARDYNIDTNRVTLSGISDGATGAYFLGMKSSSRYADLLAFIGFVEVLANVDASGQLHLSNLENLPIYSVNTTQDRLYPFARVKPSLDLLVAGGARVVIREQPGGHDTNWYGEERAAIDQFVKDTPRDPYPDKVSWATADPQKDGRHSWLVIDSLATESRENASGSGRRTGAPNDLNSIDGRRVFRRDKPFGHLELERKGRTFAGQSAGVRRFRILLNEDLAKDSSPIEVVLNGRRVFSGPPAVSLEVLLDGFERDFDPERLYLSEIVVDL